MTDRFIETTEGTAWAGLQTIERSYNKRTKAVTTDLLTDRRTERLTTGNWDSNNSNNDLAND